MLLTEEQAREKWCPHVRYLAVFKGAEEKIACGGPYNRGAKDSGLNMSRCIASDCMMWRWDEKIRTHMWHWDEKKRGVVARRGYCGLAGDPK